MNYSGLTDELIQELAPAPLANRNPHRYQGQFERVKLAAFEPEDRALLLHAYEILLSLHAELKSVHAHPSACNEVLQMFIRTPAYRDLAITLSHLGHASSAAGQQGKEVDRLVHDLRGGAFQALSFRLQLFEHAPGQTAGLQVIYFLVRDHLKIMRNCVSDLDPDRFALDLRKRDHDVSLLVEKWSQNEFNGSPRPVHVDIHCDYTGTLCESCLEFSSLDRIIYNLMNNAARFTTDQVVHFWITGAPPESPAAVRFAVANGVTREQHDVLLDQFGENVGELFRGGFTTGGHGVGARICADFCAHAFGISSFDEALHSGYFGARLRDDDLILWFHWPVSHH